MLKFVIFIFFATVSSDPFPFVVSLKNALWRANSNHFCTGTIIAPKWVLTAGHCFTSIIDNPVEWITVHVGEYLTHGTTYNIVGYTIHQNQSESTKIYRNDLCLVELETEIDVPMVPFGTIRNENEVPVYVVGWGRTSTHGTIPDKKRVTHLGTVGYHKCQEMHDLKNNIVDKSTQICGAGGSLCFGDSGSPLFSASGTMVGVFSTMEDCTSNYPLLFVRISKYIDWIHNTIKMQ
ncbi:chymotrypsin-like elastase family member 3B [Tribolium madens]|uniref:chymotrypsin-like elastase family member 3B n=1 Tax=Tribolium madens TaxID=41895 RepID=UPI001CF71DC1|nr:chymotrypsin-like elastase family member 3B [Tribolium madens]